MASERRHDETTSDRNKSPEQLEREIQATRSEIEGTLEQLGERLSPGQLLDQGLSYLRESGAPGGAKSFFTNLGATVRDNPVPVIVTAAGMVWLARSDPGARGSFRAGSWDGMADDEPGRLERAGQGLSRGASEAKERLSEAGSELGRKSGELRRKAGRQATQARQTWNHALEEQPLLLGLAALALGALAGAGLPPTEREDELLGEARDDLLTSAAKKGRETAEEVREEAARKEAQKSAARRRGEKPQTSLPPLV